MAGFIGVLLLAFTPFAVGMISILLPALGWQPLTNTWVDTQHVWLELWQQPELVNALLRTLVSGVVATLLALVCAYALVAKLSQTQFGHWLGAVAAPLLSIPHSAAAIGLAFLLAPSGWLFRLVSPWLTDWQRPPNLITIQDPYTLSLILALVLKEMPYLVFVMMAIARQDKIRQLLTTSQQLGYPPLITWGKLLPTLFYRELRLPIFIVLSFNLTVVDVAQILGPDTPPTFAVLLLHWFQDPAIDRIPIASAGALLLLALVAAVSIGWELCARSLLSYLKNLTLTGSRQQPLLEWGLRFAYLLSLLLLALAFLALLVLPIWGFAQRWRFPDLWPQSWSFDTFWRIQQPLLELTANTFMLGVTSVMLALLASLLLLEVSRILTRYTSLIMILFYLPLVLPQIGFLFGIHISLIVIELHHPFWTTAYLHWLYVLPYVLLTLKGPYLAFNQNYLDEAIRLRPHPLRNYLGIKLAMLKPALFTATAIGFAVSVAQYLPTLIGGEGRLSTLTTEAVAQAVAGDRKRVGLVAMTQALLPLLAFLLAALLPRIWTPLRLRLKYPHA
ncbi:ABC transporter permease [Maribrevibacterium harenarium]|uniref:ABC transporter permease n=1 Tax=Maribrevibacterium harenarium TaxID=2589817 RepID=UPI001F470B9B|nr:ABC transporter permease [Maribrevibacterium harenarium]